MGAWLVCAVYLYHINDIMIRGLGNNRLVGKNLACMIGIYVTGDI